MEGAVKEEVEEDADEVEVEVEMEVVANEVVEAKEAAVEKSCHF